MSNSWGQVRSLDESPAAQVVQQDYSAVVRRLERLTAVASAKGLEDEVAKILADAAAKVEKVVTARRKK